MIDAVVKNNKLVKNSSNISNQQIICIVGTSNNNRTVIEMDGEIEENSSIVIPVERQTRYRSRQKKQPRLNNINTISLNDVTEYYIGPMDVYCIHCNAKHFITEKISNKGHSFHDYCNHGAVYLHSLPDLPKFIRNLFDGSHIKSNDFFQHIRSYNSSFSFALFKGMLE